MLDAERFRALQEIDAALGTAASTGRLRDFGVFFDGKPGALTFLGATFQQGEQPAVITDLRQGDVDEIGRWVHGASRQADLVAVSLHAHEGPANAIADGLGLVQLLAQMVDIEADPTETR